VCEERTKAKKTNQEEISSMIKLSLRHPRKGKKKERPHRQILEKRKGKKTLLAESQHLIFPVTGTATPMMRTHFDSLVALSTYTQTRQ